MHTLFDPLQLRLLCADFDACWSSQTSRYSFVVTGHDIGRLCRMFEPKHIRVVADVHGNLSAFEHASATDRFIIQLGDLIDYGPDSLGTLRLMLRLLREQRGVFIAGNHERKLARALLGKNVTIDQALAETLRQLSAPRDDAFTADVCRAIKEAPTWIRLGRTLFVHGGFHPAMLYQPSPSCLERMAPPLARALFGKTTPVKQLDGYPTRTLEWVDQIPDGFTVYCGHDQRSTNGLPYTRHGRLGGSAVFVDLGSGKGGHLAWIDLDV